MRSAVRLRCMCILALPVALAAMPLRPGRGDDLADKEIHELVSRLGDRRFAVREAAARRLLELPAAEQALRAALRSSDSEVARRADTILKELRRRSEPRALARIKEHIKRGEVDQAVELFNARSDWREEKACWQAFTGLAADLFQRARKVFGETTPQPSRFLPAGDFEGFLRKCNAQFMLGARIIRPWQSEDARKQAYVLRGSESRLDGLAGKLAHLMAWAGSLRVTNGPYLSDLNDSVVCTTGAVELGALVRSLLICDGDLKMYATGSSLIIVRGDVYCADGGIVGNSSIIMTGRLRLGKEARVYNKAVIRERATDLLGFVKFFEPAQVGIEVEPAKGGVRIKAVDARKAFARAGLQAGEVISAVDGKASTNPEVFRRQLRGALVRDGFTLQVTRGGEDRHLQIRAAPK